MLTPLLCPAHMDSVCFTPYLGKGTEECFSKTFSKFMDNWSTKGCPLPVRVLGVLGGQALCKDRAGS